MSLQLSPSISSRTTLQTSSFKRRATFRHLSSPMYTEPSAQPSPSPTRRTLFRSTLVGLLARPHMPRSYLRMVPFRPTAHVLAGPMLATSKAWPSGSDNGTDPHDCPLNSSTPSVLVAQPRSGAANPIPVSHRV